MTIGSQKLIQAAVNHRPELLRDALVRSGALMKTEDVVWTSPLEKDEFCEYRDSAALRKAGINDLKVRLHEFWPAKGPVWDAIGKTSRSRPVFVEAKAHIPEAASPPSKAVDPKSIDLIRASLANSRKHYAPRNSTEWGLVFYQYANRLAFHQYLRVQNRIPSLLVFVNFINASEVDGPTSEDEWKGATRLMHAVLGLPSDLTRFDVFHAYLDARLLAI